jgi:hypothetical protein
MRLETDRGNHRTIAETKSNRCCRPGIDTEYEYSFLTRHVTDCYIALTVSPPIFAVDQGISDIHRQAARVDQVRILKRVRKMLAMVLYDVMAIFRMSTAPRCSICAHAYIIISYCRPSVSQLMVQEGGGAVTPNVNHSGEIQVSIAQLPERTCFRFETSQTSTALYILFLLFFF